LANEWILPNRRSWFGLPETPVASCFGLKLSSCMPGPHQRIGLTKNGRRKMGTATRRVAELILVCDCVTEKLQLDRLFKRFFWAGEGSLAYGGVVLGGGLLDLLG
jgi:hypothetical protein